MSTADDPVYPDTRDLVRPAVPYIWTFPKSLSDLNPFSADASRANLAPCYIVVTGPKFTSVMEAAERMFGTTPEVTGQLERATREVWAREEIVRDPSTSSEYRVRLASVAENRAGFLSGDRGGLTVYSMAHVERMGAYGDQRHRYMVVRKQSDFPVNAINAAMLPFSLSVVYNTAKWLMKRPFSVLTWPSTIAFSLLAFTATPDTRKMGREMEDGLLASVKDASCLNAFINQETKN